MCNIPPEEYFQNPQEVCEQCWAQVDSIEEHEAEFHPQSILFCNHESHGSKKFYFQSEAEMIHHERTFHYLDGQIKDKYFTVADVFPQYTSEAASLGINVKSHSSFKRKVSHLALANFPSKKMRFTKP